jgi:hypothetical protein
LQPSGFLTILSIILLLLPESAPIKARRGHESRSAVTPSRTRTLLDSFPIYQRVLELAVAHEERGLHSPGYMGWRWNDVEVHPTKLIRLVTSGISQISLRTRQATYYLLKNREEIKRALEKKPVEVISEPFDDSDNGPDTPTNRLLQTNFEHPSAPTAPNEQPSRITANERPAEPNSQRRENKTQTK